MIGLLLTVTLRDKCPNAEFLLLRLTDNKKLRIKNTFQTVLDSNSGKALRNSRNKE